jgi:hypothetical protein
MLKITSGTDRPLESRAFIETVNVSPTRAEIAVGSATNALAGGETARRMLSLVIPATLALKAVSPTDRVVTWPTESTVATAGFVDQ